LLMASFRSAYLYDVRTGVMVQEISDIQGLLPDENGWLFYHNPFD
jgi:hypothetical protein